MKRHPKVKFPSNNERVIKAFSVESGRSNVRRPSIRKKTEIG